MSIEYNKDDFEPVSMSAVDPYAELKLAEKEGKQLQVGSGDGIWTDVRVGLYLTFNMDVDRYRVKPEENKTGLVPHVLKETIIAFANGATIQIGSRGSWTDLSMPNFNPDFQYRVKPDNGEAIAKLEGKLEVVDIELVELLEYKARLQSELEGLRDE